MLACPNCAHDARAHSDISMRNGTLGYMTCNAAQNCVCSYTQMGILLDAVSDLCAHELTSKLDDEREAWEKQYKTHLTK
ncbi:MAG: hypothetical protein NVS3B3_09260 [Aquirhabdus sp.]